MKRIVQVGTLAAFCAEVAAPAAVRLNMTEMAGSSRGRMPIPYKDVELSLQGINGEDEVVWLMWSFRISFPDPDQEFMNPRGHSIYRLMPEMQDRVRAWLAGQGYQVRDGRYALPKSVTQMRGHFECVKFVKDGEDGYRLEMGEG